MYHLPDVNFLVAAIQLTHEFHARSASHMRGILRKPRPVALLPEVLAGTIRILTLPIPGAVTSAEAAGAIAKLLEDELVSVVRPSFGQITTFLRLCETMKLRGNDAPDALLAAAALDLGGTVVSWDRGFSRFPGLTWQTPSDAQSVTNPR